MENLNGEKLKALRIKFNLTQKECADLLHIHMRTWQRYEAGESIPPSKQELLIFKLRQLKETA